MKARVLVIGFLALAGAAAGGFGLYSLGMTRGMQMTAPASTAPAGAGPQHAGDVDPATGKRVLYWHDPMAPAQRFDKPGKSPFMDMQLVPVYAEGGRGAEDGGVAISPRVEQNLGIRTATVTTGALASRIEAVGNVAYNERDQAVVQARANGFLEKLYVRAALDPVRKGQPLAQLYVPDWIAAQEEFLTAARMGGSAGVAGLREGAVERMRLAGMDDAQIRLVEQTGKVQPRLTLSAPISGVITELSAREGMTVMAGAPLFRINGLSTIWVNAEVPESAAAAVRPGAPVKARAQAVPGKVFEGKVGAILPEVNAATRTLKTRIELANPRGELVPGMFMSVDFAPAARNEVVMVPTEAVIPTGKRTVVVLAETGADGTQRLRPVDVETGGEANGMTEIRKGLQPGEKVVVSGQFLIDSEASLRATASRLSDAPDAGAGPEKR
ncbi:MAG TPA: efflux RND transporter periplasmic adaptor subunit [Usitatibacter sp.]|jgi:Cu(I)/Ag(I) efflux system membrane fusion protein|nr:efflux RND transporter periplasmic adaptor subunit [Usitatibacter sp.]